MNLLDKIESQQGAIYRDGGLRVMAFSDINPAAEESLSVQRTNSARPTIE